MHMIVNCLKKHKTTYKALWIDLNEKWNQFVMNSPVNEMKTVAFTGKGVGENGTKENIRT